MGCGGIKRGIGIFGDIVEVCFLLRGEGFRKLEEVSFEMVV